MWARIFFLRASCSIVWKVNWCCWQKKQSFLLVPAHFFLSATPFLGPTQYVNSHKMNWIGEVTWLKWLSCMFTTPCHFLLDALPSFLMVVCTFGLSQGGEGYCLQQHCQQIWFKRLFNYIIKLQRTQGSEMSIPIQYHNIKKESPCSRRGAQKWVLTFLWWVECGSVLDNLIP